VRTQGGWSHGRLVCGASEHQLNGKHSVKLSADPERVLHEQRGRQLSRPGSGSVVPCLGGVSDLHDPKGRWVHGMRSAEAGTTTKQVKGNYT
jgi:hypothetical protein